MRLIDADDYDSVLYAKRNNPSIRNGIQSARRMLEKQATVDAVPVRRGKWVIGEMDVLGAPIHCSECGWGSDHADPNKWMKYQGHRWCGSCGADMREVDNE